MRVEAIVIGAGPAGLMASIARAQRGKRTLLIDRNPRIGCKLLISGGGRCNLTNAEDRKAFLRRFGRWANFFRPAFYSFDNHRTMEFFERNGLKLRVEDNGRVFPASGKSRSVVEFFEALLQSCEVEVRLNSTVVDVNRLGGGFEVVLDGGENLHCERLLIATGGASFASKCATRGDGLTWARKMGHRITRLWPHLCALKIEGRFELVKGITLKRVRIRHRCDRHRIDEVGSLVFTPDGISGPVVHNISGYLLDCDSPQLVLDLLPEVPEGDLEAFVKTCRSVHPKRKCANCLAEFLPQNLARFVLGEVGEKRCAEVSNREVRSAVERIKRWSLRVVGGPPLEWAFVTAGGIPVEEVDRSTMESRLVRGLFFAGEILEVFGPSGGYNIQFALSTGHLAGQNL